MNKHVSHGVGRLTWMRSVMHDQQSNRHIHGLGLLKMAYMGLLYLEFFQVLSRKRKYHLLINCCNVLWNMDEVAPRAVSLDDI